MTEQSRQKEKKKMGIIGIIWNSRIKKMVQRNVFVKKKINCNNKL